MDSTNIGPASRPRAAAHALDLFARVSDACAAIVTANADWGMSGRRAGQYRVDLLVDDACVGPLREAGYGVLSEESGVTAGRDGAGLVVVDPLDGSTNASLGLPYCNTSLCLVVDGVPEVAMVTNLVTGERFVASRGGGATRDGMQIRVGGTVRLAESVLATNGLPRRHWGWGQFRAMGSAALEICSVAAGGFDGYVDMTPGSLAVWDYLAALLILEEAGGAGADAFGRDLVVLDPDARRAPVAAGSPAFLDVLVAERRRDG